MGLILALLGGQIALMVVVVYLAANDPSFSIEPDYYQKGLNWDAAVAQTQLNQRLGWVAKIELGADASVLGERTLICTLADRDGQPVDGATVDAVAFSHARGGERTAVTLLPAGGGRYEASMRFARQGVWEFRLAIQRGSDTFTYAELREVYPANPGWRAGCIIRASLLGAIMAAFQRDAGLPNLLLDDAFRQAVDSRQGSWRFVVQVAVEMGIPVPAIAASLSSFDAYRSERLPANLTQGQLDYFGAHTYRRLDKPGVFHTEW